MESKEGRVSEMERKRMGMRGGNKHEGQLREKVSER